PRRLRPCTRRDKRSPTKVALTAPNLDDTAQFRHRCRFPFLRGWFSLGFPPRQVPSGMKVAKPTSRDIAFEAGVSQATVSRAWRNSPLVRPETRQRIHDIAAQLNYRVDKHAAGLRTRQSRTLALLLFEDPTSDDSQINPFFLSMLGSITRAAASIDYDVLVSFQQLSNHWHGRYEASHRADGIILLGYGDYVTYGEKLKALAEANAHFIIWGPIIDEQP